MAELFPGDFKARAVQKHGRFPSTSSQEDSSGCGFPPADGGAGGVSRGDRDGQSRGAKAGNPPFREVIQKQREIGYVVGHTHVGVIGSAGVGKSSFVNAARNVQDSDEKAARIAGQSGTTECTYEVAKYEEPSGAKLVWYDIPGGDTCKTLECAEYCREQGLYLMDLVIVIIDGTALSESDVGVLSYCHGMRIPVFLVRSRCDAKLETLRSELSSKTSSSEEDTNNAVPPDVRGKVQAFREELRSSADTLCGAAHLPLHRVYLISSPSFRSLVQQISGLQKAKDWLLPSLRAQQRYDQNALDESLLLKSIVNLCA
eukprot:Gregarina_sp_Pseudo_9__1208@NODE_1799_length_1322_cov_5_688231_g1668_i0_p1_GENE_NODE_1799_length_1322_cov_5_688231_g1668_i0NODE_1799_length_1322_cov_5_688231_g1668_i0_p1_ORF_typecomplete_len315_score95_69IIGP/PF05049_13/2_1e35MMR_HSR1/PF01926_23/2e08RsgA_GTPase/PF03193_16/0_00049RsgA_GTPase/PF03193_16/97RsgA_GTPase/PF03193_16/3_9e03FeoB_N/PF02421_18/8_2e05AIG1/PF04548_16/0_00054Roc/PF08477_13/0_0027GTP_EFTU/PF00009_27/0_0044ABC_tran/PF00005_27/0_034MeaB/PF03308_16/0_042Dynamin_N/PF00350_23/0_056